MNNNYNNDYFYKELSLKDDQNNNQNFTLHTKGTLICIIGMLIATPDSLLLRKLNNIEIFTVILYRSLIFIISLFLILLIIKGKETLQSIKDLGKLGIITGMIWGTSQLTIAYALMTASAGSVLVISAANSMFSAIFSWLLLGEIIQKRTIIAAFVCFSSIIIICYSELSSNSSENIFGILAAITSSITMGLTFTLIRWIEMKNNTTIDSNAFNIIAGLFTSIVSLIILKFQPEKIQTIDWLYLYLDGGIVMTLSYIALSIGPTMISAPEVSLCTLLETAIGPVWVYLGGYERPSDFAICGGIVLIITLTIHSIIIILEERRENYNDKKEFKYDKLEVNENEVLSPFI